MHITLDEDKTEFFPGKTVYNFKVEIPNQEPQMIKVEREGSRIKVGDKVHPYIAGILREYVREYVAKIFVQGDY